MSRRADLVGVGSPPNRFEQTYEELRAAIVDGKFAPDTRLTEAALTESLKVSRTTLRAVLVRLANEGYVTSSANVGVRTRSFGVTEALDRLRVREVLEGTVAALAAERATDEEIENLGQIVKDMRRFKESNDELSYHSMNLRFHEGVTAAGRSPIVAKFIESTLYPLIMFQYRDFTGLHPRPGSLEEHQAIFSAIVTRNPSGAEVAMRHHIASARESLLFSVQAGASESIAN